MIKPGVKTTSRGGKGSNTVRNGKSPKATGAANRKTTSKGQQGAVRSSAMPLTFFIAVIIVILGSIQLLSTFHTYALNLAELNSLRNQEAALVAKKAELENDIKRWDDDAYVTAQARERLGFVFPGERSVRVLHPEAVTGDAATGNDEASTPSDTGQTRPWYKDMFSSFGKADKDTTKSAGDASETSSSESSGSSGDGTTGNTGSNSTANTTKEGQ